MRALVALVESVPESFGTDGQPNVTLDDLLAASERFDQIQRQATIAYYAWVMDVLNEFPEP